MFGSLQATPDRRSVAGNLPATAPSHGPSEAAALEEVNVRRLLAEGKPVEAMRLARQALGERAGLPNCAYIYGVALEHVGRHEEALEAYRAELVVNPGHAESQARAKELATALVAPTLACTPTEQRDWHTSLPRPTLIQIQKAQHSYTYRGVPLLKNPFDLGLYPRLLWALQPRTIIEIGSKSGGSGLWLGDLLNNFGIDGHIYSIDLVKVESVSHPRVTFVGGDGRRLDETLRPEFLQKCPRPWLVIEDADHTYETSIAVLQFFDPWLRPGEFIVIEDGIVSDLSEDAACTIGPHRALREFLRQHGTTYRIASDYCDFYGHNLTWCTNGFLRKVDATASGMAVVSDLGQARRLAETGQTAAAMELLGRIKAQRVPLRSADYLRAVCFMREGRLAEAIEALKEELRYFPDQAEAIALLARLASQVHDVPLPAGTPPEFAELYRQVRPFTMLSPERLLSLYTLAKEICTADLPGNLVECGVAAGGSTALLAAVVARYSRRPRCVFSCDSFEGLPDPEAHDRQGGHSATALGWSGGTCAAPMESLNRLCRQLGVDSLVEPVRGFFDKTLPVVRGRMGPIALLHADGDWYKSTRDVLDNLFDQVIDGGRVQIDDYGFWEGCRRAVDDFQRERCLHWTLRPIDGTGVWFVKRVSAATPPTPAGVALDRLNVGCGAHFHPAWVNVDIAPADPSVLKHDLRRPLPFADGAFQAVYHSHVLEHLHRPSAMSLLRECHRVLAPGGVLRVVVPDLETIAKLYLHNLEMAAGGDIEAHHRLEWITLELFDQMTREQSGGQMLQYWRQDPMPAEKFVIERMGQEVKRFLEEARANPGALSAAASEPDPVAMGRFRQSGEIHRWMYDRVSLGALLTQAGFAEVRVCGATESRIPGFCQYRLDVSAEGEVRKPDSLFMEAVKPGAKRP